MEEKCFAFQVKLFPLEHYTNPCLCFLRWVAWETWPWFERSQSRWTNITLNSLQASHYCRRKPSLPASDKSKLKTACQHKPRLTYQAPPGKLIPRAESPAGHFPPLHTVYSNDGAILDQQATQMIMKKTVQGLRTPRVFQGEIQCPPPPKGNDLHLPGASQWS